MRTSMQAYSSGASDHSTVPPAEDKKDLRSLYPLPNEFQDGVIEVKALLTYPLLLMLGPTFVVRCMLTTIVQLKLMNTGHQAVTSLPSSTHMK